jgi:hypothetical protein
MYFISQIFVRLLILSINDDNQRLVRKSLDILVVREIYLVKFGFIFDKG